MKNEGMNQQLNVYEEDVPNGRGVGEGMGGRGLAGG
jgi:hypothetical protein